jgi:prepilin-type N-terminal cleavage/methylation domain-containing protein
MKTSTGFSLIEMAVVLLIIGLLIGGFLSPLSSSLTHQKIKLTQQSLEEIKEALLGFAIIYQRLPCPASNENGIALNVGDTNCNKEGYLPWADLGVGRYDAWGKTFRYRVEEEYTNTTTVVLPISTNTLRVKNRQNNYLTNKSGDSRVVAIIFSYGQNGEAEEDNQNTSSKLYMQDGYIENQFDDVLTWLSRNTLINRLLISGKWPINP